MAVEIERKFLLKNDDWRLLVSSTIKFRQGYIGGSSTASVRIRIEGNRGFLNIKSATLGTFRHEYEYEIPVPEADEMLETLCEKPLIEKQRHYIQWGSHTWEIDEFEGENEGLIVAEIELNQIDEEFERPDWLGNEVSDDIRYYNVNLVKNPYGTW